MLNLQLAHKYSRAIFELAQEEGKLEAYGKELLQVKKDLEDVPAFARFAPAEAAFAEEAFAEEPFAAEPAEEDFRVPLFERPVLPEPALPEELLPVALVLVFVRCAMKLPVYS